MCIRDSINVIFAPQIKQSMLIIPVKEGESIDRALKRFKRKFDRTGKLKSLRERKAYIKPSVRQRDKLIKASYVQRLKDIENQ